MLGCQLVEGGRTEDVRLGAELDLARLRLPRGGDKQSFCKKEQTEGERQHEILTFSYKMIHKKRHQYTKPQYMEYGSVTIDKDLSELI